MKPVTDASILEKLNSPVTDPQVLAQLESTGEFSGFTPVRKALQGATFGFGDELQSGIAALSARPFVNDRTIGELFDESMGELRAERESFSNQHPITSAALEAGGGLATGGLLGGAVLKQTGKSLGRRVGETGALGAAEGAIYGAGTGNPGDRLRSSFTGAGIGGILGPAIGLPAAKLAEVAAPMVRNAFQKATSTPSTQAENLIANTVAREGVTSDEIAETYFRQGSEGTLLDTSTSLQDLGRFARDKGDQSARLARSTLESRQLGATDRMVDVAQTSTGKNASEFSDTVAQLNQQRSNQAGPLYKEAFEVGEVSDKMTALVQNRPTLKAAWKKAERIAQDAGDEIDTPFKKFHYAKLALDRNIESTLKTSKTEARSKMKLKNELLDAMDEASPAYKQARDIYAGDSQLINSAEQGANFMKMKADEIDDLVAGMSASEKELFRHGAVKSIVDNLEDASMTADPSRRLVNKKSMLRKLEHLFDSPADAERFIEQAAAERSFMESRNRVLQGSMTSTNLSQQPQVTNPTMMMRDLGNRLVGEGTTNPEVLDEAMGILLNQGLTREQIMALLSRNAAPIPSLGGQVSGATAAATGSVHNSL